MVNMTSEKALTTTGERALFDISFLPDMTEIKEVMEENMEGVNLKFERLKVPSGGGIIWEVPDEDGEVDTIKELLGVIIDHHPVNAYWSTEFTGENNPPDCSALDGMRGEGNPGGMCATCPNNQFGTDPRGGKGKACKNLHRVYIVREGEIFPLLLAVPPTSLDNFRTYVRRLTSKMRRVTSVLTKFTLVKDKNDGGIVFSKIVFSRAGDLDKETAKKMAEFAKVMKPYLRQIAVTGDEYDTSDSDGTGVSDAEMDAAMGFTGQTVDAKGGAVEDENGKAW